MNYLFFLPIWKKREWDIKSTRHMNMCHLLWVLLYGIFVAKRYRDIHVEQVKTLLIVSSLFNRFQNELIVAVGKGEPDVVMSEYGFKYIIPVYCFFRLFFRSFQVSVFLLDYYLFLGMYCPSINILLILRILIHWRNSRVGQTYGRVRKSLLLMI